jgi:hypothetical protein
MLLQSNLPIRICFKCNLIGTIKTLVGESSYKDNCSVGKDRSFPKNINLLFECLTYTD